MSQVKLTGIDNTDNTFKAIITSVPLPAFGVYFEGDKKGVDLARQALQEAGFNNQPSLYVREEPQVTHAQFRLLAKADQYLIVKPADDRPLVAEIQGYSTENAQKAIQRLEHIARWTSIAKLDNPAPRRIKPNDFKMEMIPEEDGSSAFTIKLTNNWNKNLYCALLDLTETYAVNALFPETGSQLLKPGEEIWAFDGEPIDPTVPDELWEQGVTEFKDILKLIVSTAAFDASLLTQDKLDIPRSRTTRNLTSPGQSTLDRLMNRVQSRDLVPRSKGNNDDWFTKQEIITAVRPLKTTQVSNTNNISLGAGVTLLSHPSLQAEARLTTTPQASRDFMVLPPILREAPSVNQTFQFTTSRGTDDGLSVLELNQVKDSTLVTPETPLKLVVDQSLRDNEFVLPVGYDGEFFLPLGLSRRTKDGKTEIELQRLPDPVSERHRSLGGAIRIWFQKIISKPLGREFEYPLFRIADVDEKVNYENDMTKIQARVAKAKRILLYIHGIIGDTEDMVKSVQRAQISLNGQQGSLKERYDLVLTFDYESINTPIEEIARSLKQRLESVGLGANHGKTLHIVAHSMGGLVSRWFIEREGGNQIVQHLTMLGTPNAGSPWSNVQDWALVAMGIGLNHLSKVVWPAKVLSWLVDAIEKVDVSLDQMNPTSDFIQSLAVSKDPGIPYAVIAGNTNLISLKDQGIFKRLMNKLFYSVAEFPFFGQANDIAVTVDSIKNIPEGRLMLPHIQEVSCDHLTYFNTATGLNALAVALTQAEG
jgi:pimeloyl-ACP methyl ester carboxylesterase